MIAGIAAIDAVVAVGVDELAEVFVGINESGDVLGGVLIVHVVIGQTVTEQQGSAELIDTGDGTDAVVAIGVLVGRAHEALGIDGVVEAPARGRGDGDAAAEYGPPFAHGHQRVPAAIAPAPNGDVLFVDIALLSQPQGSFHLVLGL